MNKYIPIYDIFLKPHESFSFYLADDKKILPTTCIDRPLVRVPSTIWDKSIRDYKYNTVFPNAPAYQNTHHVPTWGVKKEDLDEHLWGQSKSMIETCLDNFGDKDFTFIIPQKETNYGIIEVGIAGLPVLGFTDHHNEKLEKLVNRYVKLKVFW